MTLNATLLRTLTGHRQAVYALANDNGNGVFSAGGDGMVVRWEPLIHNDGMVTAQVPEPVYSLLCLRNGNLLAGTHSGALYIISNGKARRIAAHNRGIYSMIEADGGFITAGGDGRLMVWDENADVKFTVQISPKSLRRIISAGGGFFTAGSDGVIRELDRSLAVINSWQEHQLTVFALAWIPGSAVLVSAGRDALIRFHAPYGGNEPEEIKAHLLHVHDLQLSPGGVWLASASMDKTIKIWNAGNFGLNKVLDQPKYGLHRASVNSLLWLNENTLISASDDRCLGLWQLD